MMGTKLGSLMLQVATGDIGYQLKITVLCLVATLYWFSTARGMKGKASWWGDRINKYIKTIWDDKVINVAPRTNDHNCLMPNHPFHTQFMNKLCSLSQLLSYYSRQRQWSEDPILGTRYTSYGMLLTILNHLLLLQLFSFSPLERSWLRKHQLEVFPLLSSLDSGYSVIAVGEIVTNSS